MSFPAAPFTSGVGLLQVSTTEQSNCQVGFLTLAHWDKGPHATERLQEEAPMDRNSLFVILCVCVRARAWVCGM